ncbi:zinc finger and BTB domain-containing protein [Pimephales promelas]|nr:zinc finger and BTB domain-containing protein [Pimephales promelas]
MQVDDSREHESSKAMESSASSNGERSGESDKNRDGPGTPTRSSVITSARELHYVREEGMGDQQAEVSQMGLEAMAGMTEKHLASLYGIPPNHKNEAMLSMPASMASSLHMSPALAMSMDFSAYGGLLPQSFIQREFFSKLGELAAGMKPDGRVPNARCAATGLSVCHGSQALGADHFQACVGGCLSGPGEPLAEPISCTWRGDRLMGSSLPTYPLTPMVWPVMSRAAWAQPPGTRRPY